ncbi:MAG: universal stress protein [Nitrososphaerota archaeon]|jgi:nucleotide-binding universal stress UspA family protein|nr:universal stress protein [Nitrososphaerota archaeon]
MQVLRRFLVGYDGSVQAERALEFAIAIASQTEGSEIHVGYVVQKPGGVPDPIPDELMASLRRTGRETLMNAERTVRKNLVEVAVHLEAGSPGEKLLELAGRLKPDLVVLGTLQHSASEKLLGTVSSYFLKSREFPLLIVP